MDRVDHQVQMAPGESQVKEEILERLDMMDHLDQLDQRVSLVLLVE
jgi:hypothetical protein